ncbi:MAG: Holliday junction branch migration DNA helicase RuvB [Spirochaetaceae bacterium]|nr:MAG: Holliday junction branch migration DNA helicase RuvB [Spirochaetaceae bacterium]
MSDPGLLHPEIPDDDAVEQRLRPSRLDEFQGQDAVKKNLEVFITAARNRGDALDHVFLSGPPGLGKTTLAGIMAQEMGVDFKVTAAPALEKPKDLAGILTTVSERSVFFIDEIHRLKPAIEEMLYIAMEDYQLDWIIGQGPSARTVRIPVPPFTLIGATTKAGLVAGPLYSRFGIPVRLDFYTLADIRKIICRSATILDVELEATAVATLARCSRGTPRVANRLLRRVRDFAEVLGDGRITAALVDESMRRLEIDVYGLEQHDRRILETIIRTYNGGPVGAETLAISVGETIDTLEDFYEPYLIQRGFLMRTPRGRVATALAYQHLGLPGVPPENDEDQGLLFRNSE